jgi:hypothetical protein
MKKAILLTAIFFGVSFLVIAQKEEIRTLEPFNEISASGGVKIVLIPGESEKVELKGENESDLKMIKTPVNGGKLMVSADGKTSDKVTIEVYYKNLSAVQVTGTGKVNTRGPIKSPKFKVEVTGASNANLELQCDQTDVNLSGASNITLSGKSSDLNAHITGASGLKAQDLDNQNASMFLTGASSAKVAPKGKLQGSLTGASSLKYYSDPAEKEINVTGSSSVKKAGEGDDKSGQSKGKWDIKKFREDDFKHWAGFEMGVNGYLGSSGSVSLSPLQENFDLNYARSLNFNLNIIEHDFNLWKNRLNLVTGLGFSWNNYGFRRNITLDPNSSFTFASIDSGINYTRNKLRTSSLTLPLLLEFNASDNPDKTFHLAAGITGSWVFRAKTLQEFNANGYNISVERRDDYNINPFQYAATVRLGVGDFTLYANYGLSTLFEKNKGTDLNPFSIGLRIIPF